VKKFHPRWARENELDTLIDRTVETSIIYDLVLFKDVNEVAPEVVPLQSIAFCDQTDVMAGPICIKHQYSVSDLLKMKGKWDDSAIDQAILQAQASKTVALANGQEVKTPGKYIEAYELHGNLKKEWLPEEKRSKGNKSHEDQLQIACYYTGTDGKKNGITLFAGPSKPLDEIFDALKIDEVGSYGRACGRSIIEMLFDPQVWRNYNAIKIKKLLDSAVNLFITDSDELGNQKLSSLPENTILKQAKGDVTQRLDGQLQNLPAFTNDAIKWENNARVLGSASDAQLGTNPVSGTPFALQNLVVQQGQGIHEYRQGKIATFFADRLYPKWILPKLVKEMNDGKKFSEELSLDELKEISDAILTNEMNRKKKEWILAGELVTQEMEMGYEEMFKKSFQSAGTRRFFELLKGELDETPVDVFVNIKGKQKYMAQNADKLTNLIRAVMSNPQAFSQIPGIGKMYNELLENSGMSPVDFSQITAPQPQLEATRQKQPQLQPA
jgi:hypothetical protein